MTSALTLANKLHECEGRARILQGLSEASEVKLDNEWMQFVVNEGEAVLSWTNSENITVRRVNFFEQVQGQNRCSSESEDDLTLTKKHRQACSVRFESSAGHQ